MYKRLSDEQQQNLIEAGIREFAQYGYAGANLTRIAKAASMSVGVIYKYYVDKEAFFLQCLQCCLDDLAGILKRVAAGVDVMSMEDIIRELVRTLISYSKDNRDAIRMYLEITAGSAGAGMPGETIARLAQEIEGVSALLYTDICVKAQKEGILTKDADPALFAFFFDNLLMMLQFSYCCDYYHERMRIYGGQEVFDKDEHMVEQLTGMLMRAFKA